MVAKLSAGTFYGKTHKRYEAAGFTFAESIYTPESQLNLPLHTHENAFLYLVIEGVCEETCGRKTKSFRSPALVYHPAGEPHGNRWHPSGGRAFHIDISKTRVEAIREYTPNFGGSADIQNGVAPWLAGRLYREYQRLDDVSLLAMEGLALEVLAEMSRIHRSRSERTPARWLLATRDLLHARFTEDLSLNEIALEVGIHPVHLARVFRRDFGVTLGEYQRKLRVEFACRQLASTDMPLIQIALSAGFADQSHFTRTFRRLMQVTPGEFRRNIRSR